MIPRGFIQHWRQQVPWIQDAQVEQDLVLSRALAEIFAHAQLRDALALRGGTAFNKLYTPQGSRYSEDIDLVQVRAEAIGPTTDAIRALLDPWLGEPQRSSSDGNFTLRYRFTSEGPPSVPLGLKVEINTREHFTVFGYQDHGYTVASPWFNGQAGIRTYGLDELLGTKLRALYQRKKGRDLFDLWKGLNFPGVQAPKIAEAFGRYMDHGGYKITRKQFLQNIQSKMKDPVFMADISPLLAEGTAYDPHQAMAAVEANLISILP